MNHPIHAALTVVTGRLVGPIDDLYSILSDVTGDSIFTHVIPRAYEFAKPELIAQHSGLAKADHYLTDLDNALADLNEPAKIKAACEAWVRMVAQQLGLPSEIEVKTSGAWRSMDPIEEAISMKENQ